MIQIQLIFIRLRVTEGLNYSFSLGSIQKQSCTKYYFMVLVNSFFTLLFGSKLEIKISQVFTIRSKLGTPYLSASVVEKVPRNKDEILSFFFPKND